MTYLCDFIKVAIYYIDFVNLNIFRLSEFLSDSAERIIILKIVYKRVQNR